VDYTDLWDLENVDRAASGLDTLGLSLGNLADVAELLLVEHCSWRMSKLLA
jgi:hypothetical protein